MKKRRQVLLLPPFFIKSDKQPVSSPYIQHQARAAAVQVGIGQNKTAAARRLDSSGCRQLLQVFRINLYCELAQPPKQCAADVAFPQLLHKGNPFCHGNVDSNGISFD